MQEIKTNLTAASFKAYWTLSDDLGALKVIRCDGSDVGAVWNRETGGNDGSFRLRQPQDFLLSFQQWVRCDAWVNLNSEIVAARAVMLKFQPTANREFKAMVSAGYDCGNCEWDTLREFTAAALFVAENEPLLPSLEKCYAVAMDAELYIDEPFHYSDSLGDWDFSDIGQRRWLLRFFETHDLFNEAAACGFGFNDVAALGSFDSRVALWERVV